MASTNWRRYRPTVTTVGASKSRLLFVEIKLVTTASTYLSRRLQSVLNAAARLIFGLRRSDHVSDALISLRWLRIPQCIQFKVAVSYVRGPPWLRAIVPWSIRPCGRLTESTSSSLRHSRLIQPQSNRSTVGDRAFPVAGPQVWNSLPPDLTSAPSLDTFRRRLKTHRFTVSYSNIQLS